MDGYLPALYRWRNKVKLVISLDIYLSPSLSSSLFVYFFYPWEIPVFQATDPRMM